jgi:hypothetical protein
MAFIRRRLSGKQRGSYSYQIVESYREAGKVKARYLYNLRASATIGEAIEAKRRELAQHRVWLAELEDSGYWEKQRQKGRHYQPSSREYHERELRYWRWRVAVDEAILAFLESCSVTNRNVKLDTTARQNLDTAVKVFQSYQQ